MQGRVASWENHARDSSWGFGGTSLYAFPTLENSNTKRPLTAPDKENYPSDPPGINLRGGTKSVHRDGQLSNKQLLSKYLWVDQEVIQVLNNYMYMYTCIKICRVKIHVSHIIAYDCIKHIEY